jgi:hypothetical protein
MLDDPPSQFPSQHLMALRAAHSAVKMGSPAVVRVGGRGLGLPRGRDSAAGSLLVAR